MQSLAQTCLSVCGEGKACVQSQWEQQHIQIMSRLLIPSRSRDGEGGPIFQIGAKPLSSNYRICKNCLFLLTRILSLCHICHNVVGVVRSHSSDETELRPAGHVYVIMLPSFLIPEDFHEGLHIRAFLNLAPLERTRWWMHKLKFVFFPSIEYRLITAANPYLRKIIGQKRKFLYD